ncbi:heme peroxidase superfamily protein [Mycobacteroides abscessus subsp. abscessus]|nr:hypothetical protein DDJ46_11870 [Mycobacteroides abscessus]SKX54903.1 heme peroxidase superfamily protein [Mycobacteroides abscessus subsp. abscessus]SLB68183.1 heme peroxidase superfamily protein [Mycobacteroides abscessus subsp. abscessus]
MTGFPGNVRGWVLDEVALLLGRVRAELPSSFDHVPDGWPGAAELALIDAVLSIQARYGASADKGVRGAIARYKKAFPDRAPWDDLQALAAVDAQSLAEVLGNRQSTGGVLKAAAIVDAAGRLAAAGAVHAVDVDECRHKSAYVGTKGLGPVTWSYFLMLLGHDGVKADTLVTRFVTQAVGRDVSAEQVGDLVTDAAKELGVPATVLDHAIWRHMSAPRKD